MNQKSIKLLSIIVTLVLVFGGVIYFLSMLIAGTSNIIAPVVFGVVFCVLGYLIYRLIRLVLSSIFKKA